MAIILVVGSAVVFGTSCGFGADAELGPRYDIDIHNPVEWKERFRVKWETKWKFIGCSFLVEVDAEMPPEYAHYKDAVHLLQVLGDKQVRSAYVAWDRLQVPVPCGMCGASNLSGAILVRDGARLVTWGEGDGSVWPPLLVHRVRASFVEESGLNVEYEFVPKNETREDVYDNKPVLFDMDEACKVLNSLLI
jgi:hypothetical protein